jgi:UDP-GlcNAc3NAcA epimerase
MKIVTIVGARPQFIKAAPVSRALHDAGLTEVVIHTGQHYDATMSDLFFDELGLAKPAYNLDVGSGAQGVQTARMLEGIEPLLTQEKPDWVLIYGDTNSTLAGALAAAKLNIPIAHVEAGARSFNRAMPEEINRVVADRLSSLLFAASETAVANLRQEGIAEASIEFVGDVMFDAIRLFSTVAEQRSRILDRLALKPKSFALATIHRAANTDDPQRLTAIFAALTDLARELPVVFPLHPRTRAAADARASEAFTASGSKLIEPVGYFDMLMLERHAALIVTDSGGVQKEAFFNEVPCITLRKETEWTELVTLGWNTLLAPAQAHRLRDLARELRGRRGKPATPYGDGNAAKLIAARLAASAAAR